MQVRYAAIAAGLALGLMSGAAKAAPLQFTLVGIEHLNSGAEPDQTFNLKFTIESDAVPDYAEDVFGIGYTGISYTGSFEESGPFSDEGFIGFPLQEFGGGLSIINNQYPDDVMRFLGSMLYNGDPSSPIFSLGTHKLAGGFLDTSRPVGGPDALLPDVSFDAVLTIALSPVPLPASASMFGAALLTLGAVGYGLKRKKGAINA